MSSTNPSPIEAARRADRRRYAAVQADRHARQAAARAQRAAFVLGHGA